MNELISLGKVTTSFAATLIIVLLLSSLSFLLLFGGSKKAVPGAPVHGSHWPWEPTFWLQSRFTFGARDIISSGYRKFKDRPFIVKRYDVDITIMPNKYLEEMRLMPTTKLDGSKAQVENLLPRWTSIDTITESNLHIRAVQNKLIVELHKYLDIAQTELNYAWPINVPSSQEWREVDIQQMSARRIFKPLMDKHADAVIKRREGQQVDEEDTLLNWMMDHGTEDENQVDKMATRQAIITLASVHTTSMAIINMIFDLCAYPEWVPILREEIDKITTELGPIGSTPESGSREWLPRLEKLDSFFLESQRMSPALLLAPQRVAMEPLTLKDGTYIPKGSRICWAGYDRINDAHVTPNPEVFDPMRSYRKRYASLGQRHKFLAGQTSPDNLAFGYGKLACPGRAFAVGETKLILSRLIAQYDFRFPETIRSRPENMYADKNVFPDPNVKVMMRRRKDA
ncbi:hypothetical protein O1611_g5244 [Lasiodiplodia mahajangana]|uniref:Uncharacterized protein n=1 Tax=Lasiodiplodia mahajangana TaxID=1108764 RepID=A0ACC2JLK4_9PEZI|nr:hypothetical protein O1611_g5244 [Lasiodiplodia mahajangana]